MSFSATQPYLTLSDQLAGEERGQCGEGEEVESFVSGAGGGGGGRSRVRGGAVQFGGIYRGRGVFVRRSSHKRGGGGFRIVVVR